jgi:hypothetical protein
MWVGVSKAGYSIKEEVPMAFARLCSPRDNFDADLVEILLKK